MNNKILTLTMLGIVLSSAAHAHHRTSVYDKTTEEPDFYGGGVDLSYKVIGSKTFYNFQ